MSEEKRQHLEFLQNIITRMNTNSFQIKGLTITLVTALLAVYANNTKVLFIFLAILPTIFLWCLDSYYLQQERKFRGIYNDVANLQAQNEVKDYEMPIDKYIGIEYSYFNGFCSRTTIWVYLPIVIILILSGIFAN